MIGNKILFNGSINFHIPKNKFCLKIKLEFSKSITLIIFIEIS